MNTLVLMVGLPASGKSTYAKSFESGNTIVLSSDEYRKRLLGDERCQDNNDLVFKTIYKDARELLQNGKNVVIDATNINMKARRRVLANFADLKILRQAVVMATPYLLCVRNDEQRERKVGEEVIRKFLYRFEIPMEYEGFDEVTIVKRDVQEGLPLMKEKMDGFDQKNDHHKYNLRKHCELCGILVALRSETASLRQAAIYHDIGKLFTQTFGEDGQAHYYSHHNVGAYYYMCSCGVGDINEIFYINFHMSPFFWKEEKTRAKYKRLFGDFLYDNLMILHECDKLASGRE